MMERTDSNITSSVVLRFSYMKSRVLINGKWKLHTNTTGVQRYASQLVRTFDEIGFSYSIDQPKSRTKGGQTAWEQFKLPIQAKSFDTLFCPANMAPIVVSRHIKLVMTLHCLRFHYHPQSYSKPFVAWYRFAIPRLLKRADVILTVSNTAAEEIQREYPVSRNKVQVVYPGISDHFRSNHHTKKSCDLPDTYWIFVGNTGDAKNLRVLVEAIGCSQLPHRVALLGIDPVQLEAYKRINPNQKLDQFIPLGHVNDPNQVASIMRGAIGLLTPSLYESFNLPMIEAMVCGIPVLASDTQVHQEIGAQAPIYIPSDVAQQWGDAMDKIATDLAWANEVVERGAERSSHFRWDDAAKSIAEILQQ